MKKLKNSQNGKKRPDAPGEKTKNVMEGVNYVTVLCNKNPETTFCYRKYEKKGKMGSNGVLFRAKIIFESI